MSDVRWVKSADLRLPPEREDGPDEMKLADQWREFGETLDNLPPLWVTECRQGELLINNGVTRATRAYLIDPENLIPVDVIDVQPAWDIKHLPTIADMAA